MTWARMIMKRILHPKKWVLSAISLVSYTTLILIFVYGKTESVLAYPIYCMSAYSLVAFSVAVPDVIRKTAQHLQKSRLMRWVLSTKIADRYIYPMWLFREKSVFIRE